MVRWRSEWHRLVDNIIYYCVYFTAIVLVIVLICFLIFFNYLVVIIRFYFIISSVLIGLLVWSDSKHYEGSWKNNQRTGIGKGIQNNHSYNVEYMEDGSIKGTALYK